MGQESAFRRVQETAAGGEKKADGSWYLDYCAALIESDKTKLLARIEHAKQAIQDRIAELHRVPENTAHECSDLSDALTHLDMLLEQID